MMGPSAVALGVLGCASLTALSAWGLISWVQLPAGTLMLHRSNIITKISSTSCSVLKRLSRVSG